MELLWWLMAIALFAVGLIGTLVPAVPGTMLILAGAVLHRIMVGPAHSVGWGVLVILGIIALTSHAIDFLAGYFGARFFGATRWGTFGAIVGAFVGLFFGLPGIFIGPVIGAVAGELVSGRRLWEAGKAGWGSLLGNVGGILGKLLLGLAMIVIFLMKVPAPM